VASAALKLPSERTSPLVRGVPERPLIQHSPVFRAPSRRSSSSATNRDQVVTIRVDDLHRAVDSIVTRATG
jgi:hypothetical protein